MNTLLIRTVLFTGSILLVATVSFWPASAQQAVTFLCNAAAGHVCQFQINTASGPINFALPSGQRTQIDGVTPRADKYCVCDPGPVTPDCAALDLNHWCMGQWLDVDPGLNSQNDIANDRFAVGQTEPRT